MRGVLRNRPLAQRDGGRGAAVALGSQTRSYLPCKAPTRSAPAMCNARQRWKVVGRRAGQNRSFRQPPRFNSARRVLLTIHRPSKISDVLIIHYPLLVLAVSIKYKTL